MTFQQFHVTDVNPNNVTGGGGCICSPIQQIDCKGPYVVIPGNDMENIRSPHVVIGRACACKLVELLGTEEQVEDADVIDDTEFRI